MALVLNIETATTVCSVSVAEDGQLRALQETNNGYTHAENLHLFIRETLQQAGIALSQLSAVAVSKGPGSYTGLRIGVSAAKGIAYALGLPLISVDTLQVMATAAKEQLNEDVFFAPMIDARRMEVYTCVYNSALEAQGDTRALILDPESIKLFDAYKPLVFCGDGMPKAKALLSSLPGTRFAETITPSAKFMCTLSHHKLNNSNFEDVAYFEPFYLKDFMITTPKS